MILPSLKVHMYMYPCKLYDVQAFYKLRSILIYIILTFSSFSARYKYVCIGSLLYIEIHYSLHNLHLNILPVLVCIIYMFLYMSDLVRLDSLLKTCHRDCYQSNDPQINLLMSKYQLLININYITSC